MCWGWRVGDRVEEIRLQLRNRRRVSGEGVGGALRAGEVAKAAFDEAEASGMAAPSTCWAEAAYAAIEQVDPDIEFLLAEVGRLRLVVGLSNVAVENADRERDEARRVSDAAVRAFDRERESLTRQLDEARALLREALPWVHAFDVEFYADRGAPGKLAARIRAALGEQP